MQMLPIPSNMQTFRMNFSSVEAISDFCFQNNRYYKLRKHDINKKNNAQRNQGRRNFLQKNRWTGKKVTERVTPSRFKDII